MPEAATGEESAATPSPVVADDRLVGSPSLAVPPGVPPRPTPPGVPAEAPAEAPAAAPPTGAPPVAADVASGHARHSRFVVWTTVVALVALVVGIAVGVASTGPQRAELQRQRDELSVRRRDRQAARDQLQTGADEAEALVARTRTQLDEATSAGDAAAKAREACAKASTDASDLLLQYDNYLSDLADLSWADAGSATQRQLQDHLRTQDGIIASQQQIAAAQLADCRAAASR